MTASRARQALSWSLWFLLVLVAFNLHGTHKQIRAVVMEGRAGALTLTPENSLRILGVFMRNDMLTARYLAYADATLGRPYQGYFIRPLEAWIEYRDTDFKRGVAPDYVDPDVSPPITPAKPLMPFRDFAIEYPPGVLAPILLPALLTRDIDAYHLLFSLEMGLLLSLALFLAVRMAEKLRPGDGRATLHLSIFSALALGIVAVRCYDAVTTLAIVASAYGLAMRGPVTAGLSISLGFVAKLVPAVVGPFGLFVYLRGGRWREMSLVGLAGFCVLAMTAGLCFLTSGTHALDFLVYHRLRPIETGSTWGALFILARLFDPDIATSAITFGSVNVESIWEPAARKWAEVLPLIAIAGLCARAWFALRALDETRAVVLTINASCAALVAFMAFGKVFSANYMTWFIPFGVIATLHGGRGARWMFLLALGLTQISYPFLFNMRMAEQLNPLFGAVILSRNLVLIAWAWKVFNAALPRRNARAAAAPVAPRQAPASA